MISSILVAKGTGTGYPPAPDDVTAGRGPQEPRSRGGHPEGRNHAPRVMMLVLASALLCGVACGGRTASGPDTVELPPADPAAVREYLAGIRLMQKQGNRFQRRALARFRKAVQIDPNLWEAHYNLGVMQRRQGDLADASGSFDRALEINPSASEPLLAAAEVSYAQGDGDAAADRLETLLRQDEDNLAARVALAVILRENERYGPALEQAREVLIREPSNVRALLEVGRIYRAREQYDVAQLVLGKALQLTGEENATLRAEIQNEQGLLELDRGDTQAAFVAFEAAITLDASYKPARMNQGSVLLNAGDYAGAQAQYEAVLAQDRDDVAARVALGVTYRGQGEMRRARREYERVLRDDPDHPDAVLNLGILRAEFVDEREQSRENFEHFLRVAPGRHPGRPLAEEFLQLIPAPNAPGGPP
ncbi:MAG: tetratricopeptide repeat protein [Myxococcota bacterium]